MLSPAAPDRRVSSLQQQKHQAKRGTACSPNRQPGDDLQSLHKVHPDCIFICCCVYPPAFTSVVLLVFSGAALAAIHSNTTTRTAPAWAPVSGLAAAVAACTPALTTAITHALASFTVSLLQCLAPALVAVVSAVGGGSAVSAAWLIPPHTRLLVAAAVAWILCRCWCW